MRRGSGGISGRGFGRGMLAGKVSVRLEAGRTRAEVAEWLIEMAKETPRMVVGFDFCFSFPAWFVRDEHGVGSAPEFWKRVVEEGHAERWLMRGAEDRRFWGKPGVGIRRGRRSFPANICIGCCGLRISIARLLR